MQLEDINFQIGSVNPSGISDEVYYTPKQYIDEWPTIQNDFENAATPAAYANYQGNFKMKANKVWNRLYTTQGKGKISWEYIGETDCKMVSNKASLSYPKLTDEIRAFAKYASNGDFVFIVRHDAKYYVVGSPDYRATLTPNGDSGDAPGSAKGVTVDIECPDVTPLPVYTGIIPLSDGTLDCSTGIIQPGRTGDYSVTYNGNGNTGGNVPVDDNSPYEAGDTVTVLGNTGTLVKEDYTFTGWNTAADGSGTDYEEDDTFAISASTVLYAQWTAN